MHVCVDVWHTVCAVQIGVELRVVHLTDEYWQRVVAHCIAEIKNGRTPNPDILCNSRIKFGARTDWQECVPFRGI